MNKAKQTDKANDKPALESQVSDIFHAFQKKTKKASKRRIHTILLRGLYELAWRDIVIFAGRLLLTMINLLQHLLKLLFSR